LEASGKKPQKNNLITSKFLLTKEDVKAAEEKQLMCLMEFVVGSFLPVSICENVQFRQLIESHNPDAIPCSRENLRGVIVKKAASMRLLAKDFLSGRNVAITTDCWTSRANEPYISLTAHLIEDDWTLASLDLCCEPFPGTHKAAVIAAKVSELHTKFGIPDANIICCVTDNEPTNNKAADHMSYEWIGCIDHLVELTTGIAFDGPGVKDVMAKCRRIVGHFSSSSQAQDTLLRQQLVTGTGTPLKVVQDVVTRWWSTYSMVERLLELRVSLHQLANIDDKIAEIMLSLQEWEIVKQMERILKPFMHIQRFFEGQTYLMSLT